ncbi:mechanosensitive ion channel family protein [Georgenia sp. Z1344]|uniref:mechanosensitive ion channel family protein n=1 Tax=Georgenia sp. Z1344 TaxID=3416706 RepID=UPI003CF84AF8
MDDEQTDQAIETTLDVLSVAGSSVIGAAAGLVVALLLGAVFGFLARRRAGIRIVYARIKGPVRLLLMVIGTMVGFYLATRLPADARVPGWRGVIQHALVVAIILSVTWLVAALANVAEDFALKGVRERAGGGEVSTHGRRIQTQAVMLRRVGVVVVWIIGIAIVLLTFPGARAAGASMLASAGVLSVVAGIAAQSTLANLFAGIQLAFTDAIRVDDTIVIDGEYGYIEEITLTYVVVLTWDNRRIILPSSHFTTNPFENWTRRETSILGTVTFDVDWRVPVPAMRAEMQRLLDATPLWDKNLGIFQVYDAVGGFVTVRALVSAKDPGTLVDLRYYLREELLDFLQTHAPYALPRTRIEDHEPPLEALTPPRPRDVHEQADLDADLAELAEIEKSYRDQEQVAQEAVVVRQETVEARKQRESAARRARRRAAREDRRRAREVGGALGRRGQVGHHDDTGSQTTVMSTEALEEALAASRPGDTTHAPDADSRTSGTGAPSAGATDGQRGRATRSGRPGRADRGERGERAERGERSGRSARSPRSARSARSAWSARSASSAGSAQSASSAQSAHSAQSAAHAAAPSASSASEGPVAWTARTRTSAVSAISAGSANTAAVYPPGYPDDMVWQNRGESAEGSAVPGLRDEFPLGPLRTSLVYRFGRGLSAPSARSAAAAGQLPPVITPQSAAERPDVSDATSVTTTTGAHASSMYTGTPENEERGAKFTGPDEAVQAELEAGVERRRAATTGEGEAVDGEDHTSDAAAVAFGSVATGGIPVVDDDDRAAVYDGSEAFGDERVVEGPVEVTGALGDAPPADVQPPRSGETSVLPALDAEHFAATDAAVEPAGGAAGGAGTGPGADADVAPADDPAVAPADDPESTPGVDTGSTPRRYRDRSGRPPRGHEVVYGRDASDGGGGATGAGRGEGGDGGGGD